MLFSFPLDSFGFLEGDLDQYSLVYAPKLNTQEDTLRIEGFYLSYQNSILKQWDEQIERDSSFGVLLTK